MNARTTLDYKALIKDWQYYQQNKLKMANAFPCSFSSGRDVIPEGTLSFITQPGENRLEVRSVNGFTCATILLSDIRGYNSEGNTIQLILRPEPELLPRSATLAFPTEVVHSLTMTELQNFTREIVMVPTPPSSSESN